MNGNIYEKLLKMRESIKKQKFSSFDEFLKVVDKQAKKYRVLPLYCFYDKVATLSIVDLDSITMVLKFQIPVELVGLQNVRAYLYKMAFEINEPDGITLEQYLKLQERIKELKVDESEILERYHIESLAAMTTDIYRRCMNVLDKMSK